MKKYRSIFAFAIGMCVCGSGSVFAIQWDGGGGDTLWSTAANWDTDVLPGSADDVTISGVVTVDLDVDATINKLLLDAGATLNVTAASDVGHTLTIGAGGLEVRGTLADKSVINVLNGSTIDVLAGAVTIGPNGKYQTSAAACPEASELKAASITVVKGPGANEPPGEMILKCEMKITCTGTFEMDGFGVPPPFGGSAPLGGLTPPIVKVDASATASIGGDLFLSGTVDMTVDATAAGPLNAAPVPGAGATIFLGGNFDNRSQAPTLFDATRGSMVLNGTGPQNYEVAGALLESPAALFQNNFAFGSLTVGARPLTETVTFQDAVDNVPGGTAGQDFEWLFVNGLSLEPATVVVSRSGVAFDVLSDTGANVTVKGAGAFTSIASLFSQIPTASQWGLIAFVLALLAAATIGIHRFRRASAPGRF